MNTFALQTTITTWNNQNYGTMGAEFKSRINRGNKYIILSNPPSANNIKTIMKLFNLSKRLEIRSRYILNAVSVYLNAFHCDNF